MTCTDSSVKTVSTFCPPSPSLITFSPIPPSQNIVVPQVVLGCCSCRWKRNNSDQLDKKDRSSPLRRTDCGKTVLAVLDWRWVNEVFARARHFLKISWPWLPLWCHWNRAVWILERYRTPGNHSKNFRLDCYWESGRDNHFWEVLTVHWWAALRI